jgi:hypothetical protein
MNGFYFDEIVGIDQQLFSLSNVSNSLNWIDIYYIKYDILIQIMSIWLNIYEKVTNCNLMEQVKD